MTLELELCIRLVSAGIVGAIIGYEREFRGKGAGVRTHLLVAMGACLFMIISQYGFPDAVKFDAARIAAGVVGGLGFVCGGIIMKTGSHVVGLTTAAGIWVTGAIGLAIGSGLYRMAFLCLIVLIMCMEAMHFYTFKLGDKQVHMTVSVSSLEYLEDLYKMFGKKFSSCSWSRKDEGYKVDISLLVRKQEYPGKIMEMIKKLPNIKVESLD